MLIRVLATLVLLGVSSLSADVLIVADEFPAMEVVAKKLKNDEKISSQIISQKELPSDLGKFEAVIVYIHGALAPQPEKAFIEYTKGGGKLVALHHSISSGKRKNADWFPFLGVSLPEGDVTNGGYKWIEGVTWDLVNLNTNHFIMTNRVQYPTRIAYAPNKPELPGFTLHHSEVYLNHVHVEPRTLLMGLKFTDPKSGLSYSQERAGWLKSAGKGWIVYLMPGHTVKDFEDPAYGQIVVNAVIYKPPR
jgi:hypothetical protein